MLYETILITKQLLRIVRDLTWFRHCGNTKSLRGILILESSESREGNSTQKKLGKCNVDLLAQSYNSENIGMFLCLIEVEFWLAIQLLL